MSLITADCEWGAAVPSSLRRKNNPVLVNNSDLIWGRLCLSWIGKHGREPTAEMFLSPVQQYLQKRWVCSHRLYLSYGC